jgi:hypothetical protein
MESEALSHMDRFRVLDAAHLRKIILWVVERKGEVWFDRSGTSETIHLIPQDVPGVEIEISSFAIEALAEQLRQHTAIDVPADVRYFTNLLAQIALIAYYAGPKVGGRESADEIRPLVHEISVEFAVACATQFAESRDYVIDLQAIPARKTSMALLLIDTESLARIFDESILRMPGGDGRRRRARPRPRSDAEYDALEYIRLLETWLADANPIPDAVPTDADRRISESDYKRLSLIAKREGWRDEEMLTIIDGYLGQDVAHQSARVLIRFLMNRHADVKAIPNRVSKAGERQLLAKSHWNLREIAKVRGWSDHETLLLIEEHLFPKLDPDLVHYSNTDSGPDWVRLRAALFGSNGNALWKSRAVSSR